MPQHLQRHSADFKTKIALAALSESKTLAELATEYKVHPTQITPGNRSLLKTPLTSLVRARRKSQP